MTRNRQRQQQRGQKRRVVNLAKMNLALDLKHEASEVWFVGPVAGDLAKNNLAVDPKRSLAEVWLVGAEAKALAKNKLASGQLFIFQTDTSSRQPQPGA